MLVLRFKHQLDHGTAQRVTDVHVGLGIVIIVIPRTRGRHGLVSPRIPGFHRLYVAGKLRILASFPAYGQLGIGDRQTRALQRPSVETN